MRDDARQVLHALVHRPWYASSILLVTAVGFALLSGVFAIVDGVLFKSLGYPREAQLYAVKASSSRNHRTPTVTATDLAAWSAALPNVGLTGFSVGNQLWNHEVNAQEVGVAYIQPNFFDVIGVRPVIGGFAATDFPTNLGSPTGPAAAPAAIGPVAPQSASTNTPGPAHIELRIITNDVFRTQLGGDARLIGRRVVTDPFTGSGYRVVGVMPPGFVFPSDRRTVEYLTPAINSGYYLGFVFLGFIARIPAGVQPSDVRFRILAAVAQTSHSGTPGAVAVDRVSVEPLGRALAGSSNTLFAALLVGAVLLVLVAALNASCLMAVRSFERRTEWAIRRALGATPRDLVRVLLTEALLLIGTGAGIGLGMAAPLVRFVLHLLPADLVLFGSAAIGWRAVTFVGTSAILVAAVTTLWPLRRAAEHSGLAPGRHVTDRVRTTGQRLVVSFQVAGALVLTIAGSLLVGSLLTVYTQAQGITTSGVITLHTNFLEADSPQREPSRVQELLDRLRALPEVESVAVTATDLLSGGIPGSGQAHFTVPATAKDPRLFPDVEAVTGDFYRVVRPQLVAGRLPTDAELAHDDPVIVVSEGVAANDWPNAPALGQPLTLSFGTSAVGQTFTVVGVVKDVHWFAWDRDAVSIYGPYDLLARGTPTFLIRTSADPGRMIAEVVRTMRDTDPHIRPDTAGLLSDLFGDSVRPRRFQAWLFGSFAAASLLVVGIAILGQLAMSTAQRTREVGIRITCGATRGRIIWTLGREQLLPVVIGLAAGSLGAAWAVRLVRSYLYELTAYDGRVWAVAVGLILFTASVGTLIPAIRASRVEPTQALRAE